MASDMSADEAGSSEACEFGTRRESVQAGGQAGKLAEVGGSERQG